LRGSGKENVRVDMLYIESYDLRGMEMKLKLTNEEADKLGAVYGWIIFLCLLLAIAAISYSCTTIGLQ